MWIVLTDCRKPDSDRKSRTEYSLLLRRAGMICWRHWISVPHLTATFILYLWSWIKWKCCLLGYIVYMICSKTTESSRAQNFLWWAGQCMQPLLLLWSIPDIRKHSLLQNQNQPQLKFLTRPEEKLPEEKEGEELKLSQLLHLALDIPRDQEELYKKNAWKAILCIAVHYQISTFYIMFQPSFRLCLVIYVIRREVILAIFSDYLKAKMKKALLQYF